MSKVEEVLESISNLTVLELSELLTAFEEKFGVTAAAPVAAVAAAPAPAAAADGGAGAEEKSTFDVHITEIGEKKVQVIKDLRGLTSLGLKEAKDLVEKAPVAVIEGISKEEAEKAKTTLEEAGATIELK